MDIDSEILKIVERNKRVESDKAWETSKVRKILIALITYILISIFFVITQTPNPFVSAIVPTIGFIISTLSLNLFKSIWIKYVYKND